MNFFDGHKTKTIASDLPDGTAFQAKNIPSKNLYKFLDAIAQSFILFAHDLEEALKEMNPETTEDLIARWEKEYGLPDQCIEKSFDLQTRRDNILIKIGMNGVQTAQDFIDLAAKFGVVVEIIPGIEYYSFPFSVSKFPFSFQTEAISRFTLIVLLPTALGSNVFPFSTTKFPFPFSSTNANIIECVFNRIVPANVQVIFKYVL